MKPQLAPVRPLARALLAACPSGSFEFEIDDLSPPRPADQLLAHRLLGFELSAHAALHLSQLGPSPSALDLEFSSTGWIAVPDVYLGFLRSPAAARELARAGAPEPSLSAELLASVSAFAPLAREVFEISRGHDWLRANALPVAARLARNAGAGYRPERALEFYAHRDAPRLRAREYAPLKPLFSRVTRALRARGFVEPPQSPRLDFVDRARS